MIGHSATACRLSPEQADLLYEAIKDYVSRLNPGPEKAAAARVRNAVETADILYLDREDT
jgi:hypothetical protein